MRRVHVSALAVGAVVLVAGVRQSGAQAMAHDEAKSVADGGIKAAGWAGKVDANEAKAGMTVNSARLAMEGKNIHVKTGPATTYWKTGEMAKGNYTVSATFTESDYMGLNDHPHPYGIVIGGNDMGTDNQSLLYCAAYGSGKFIVRGFGPAAFQMNGRGGETVEAVNKAAGKGSSITQTIGMQVKGDDVSCMINGKTVATYKKADLVAAGKLKSTDGMVGVRFGHNTEALVSDFKVTPLVTK